MYASDGVGGFTQWTMNPDGTLNPGRIIPLSTIGSKGPRAVTFGPDDTLFAVDYYGQKLYAFLPVPGGWQFAYSLEPIYNANSVFLDGPANIYASGHVGSKPQVEVYPPNSKGIMQPTVVIPGDGPYCCRVTMWDEQLYVSGSTIRVFSNPMTKPVLVRTNHQLDAFRWPARRRHVERAVRRKRGNGARVFTDGAGERKAGPRDLLDRKPPDPEHRRRRCRRNDAVRV